ASRRAAAYPPRGAVAFPEGRRGLQPRLRRQAESALLPRADLVLPDVAGGGERTLSLRLLRDERDRRLRLGAGDHPRPVVRRRDPALGAPLRLRWRGDHDAPPHGTPLELRPLPRLSLVLRSE